uniref:Uncharacterized protein n=1 Tax=Mycena chlorophos TaxID=658473 RepID=A0ABQ0L9V2_MYCCL|nr:predicted protein [Mycena chlorophos]
MGLCKRRKIRKQRHEDGVDDNFGFDAFREERKRRTMLVDELEPRPNAVSDVDDRILVRKFSEDRLFLLAESLENMPSALNGVYRLGVYLDRNPRRLQYVLPESL